ncbi:synaptic vesicle protein [Culex quinquefasciatus]|uniref:Synaptic vesicle protein n=1 Tax=Culex quinquefasciatus TaxID=7176 RepID=B0W415_CULQU|nr:synaptic vesicle protein [Culex quinquefasciatus]|eukprot:XP_001843449.1 synaptic vesicle protein [Culex quinquefasciatus]
MAVSNFKSEAGQISSNQHDKTTIDDALALAKFGVFNYTLIIIAGTIITAVMLEILSISYVITVAECDLELTTSQKGILSAVVILGVIVSSHLWGFLADTQGRRVVIVSTLFLSFATTVVSSFTSTFMWMTVFRFLTGFFISGPSASIYAYLGEFHSIKTRSRAIMGASFVFGAGCMLLPGIAYLTINNEWAIEVPFLNIIYRPWRLFFVVCALPGLISAIALLKFPESPKFMVNQGDTDRAIEAVQWIHGINSFKKEPALQIKSIVTNANTKSAGSTKGFKAIMKLVWDQTAPLFMKPYLVRTVLVCILQFGTYVTAHGMFMFFPGVVNQIVTAQNAGVDSSTVCEIVHADRPTSSNETVLLNCKQTLEETTYMYTFLADVFYMFGVGLITLVIDTVGRLSVLVFVFALCGISGLLVVLLAIPSISIWFYLILVLAGFNINVINAAAVDLFPTNLRAMAVSISLMFGRIGSVFGTNINGLLLDSHCEATFWIASIILLVCGVLSFFVPDIHKKAEASISVSP